MDELPYDEVEFKLLQKNLGVKNNDRVEFVVRKVFPAKTSSRDLLLLVNAVLRVAYARHGFRSYFVTGGETLVEQKIIFVRDAFGPYELGRAYGNRRTVNK